VVSRAARGRHRGGAVGDARGGVPLHGRHDRPGHRLGQAAEGAHSPQAVLRLLRARGHTRSTSRAQGVGRQVQGSVRRRLGHDPRGDVQAPEEARGHPQGRRAHSAARPDPGLGRHGREAQAGAGPADGGLCGLPRVHRPPHRPAARRARSARGPRRHARLPDHRRQRSFRRRRASGHPERDRDRRGSGHRDARVPGREHRQVRHPGGVQPLRRRLGACDVHPVPVDQADRLALGRHPQRHHRPVAASRPRARSGRSSTT
jgi:hypothetical protein